LLQKVPNTEGKAGMAAIVDTENKINLNDLASGIKAHLPAYARPIFIRILPEMPMTGTFKLKKRDLQVEGFDLNKITDPIYILQSDGSYKRMTEEQFIQIKEGRAKL
jgi:solute carrier family 27 (fatty acid transporter), member 1/4